MVMWYWSSVDTLFWQVSIDHSMDVQYQRGMLQTKGLCLCQPVYLEYGRHLARLHHRHRLHGYAPVSNPASHGDHEKINSGVSFSFLCGYGAPLCEPSGHCCPLTRYSIITDLTYFWLFLDCSALCSDWSAILCDLCYWCNFRVFNFMAHVSSSHGCCRNNSILYNAVSCNITVRSNFRFSLTCISHFI